MKVSVEIITGTFIETEVTENATVKELKEKIATDLKLSVNRLILVFGDEEKRRMVMENEDEMMLKELGVREDSHMYLFFKHPDLISDQEERSRSREGRDYASKEEISSEAESRRGNEEEEKAKEDKEMKNEEEDRDEQEKVEEEEKEKDINEEGEKNGKDIQEDERKEET